jgi:hypothetical protein
MPRCVFRSLIRPTPRSPMARFAVAVESGCQGKLVMGVVVGMAWLVYGWSLIRSSIARRQVSSRCD